MERQGSVRDGRGTAREQKRRRLLLLAIGGLLLLAMSPLFGHHLARGTGAIFAGRDHIGAVCMIALHYLAEPIHRLFHLLFVAGLGYALWDRFAAWRRVHRTLAVLRSSAPAPGSGIAVGASAAGLTPAQVRVVAALPTPAFTVGWLWPRIYVAQEIATALTPDELAAVLAHEAEHVRRRDPLRQSLLRLISHTLFWLPALRRLADDLADEAEIRADDAAAVGRPLVLAAAILNLAQWKQPRPRSRGVVGFDERHLLDRRVRRLAGEETEPRSHVTRRSVVGACSALLLVWASGAAIAHPLPDGHAHPRHCEHPGELAWTHLFCRAELARVPLSACPHVRS